MKAYRALTLSPESIRERPIFIYNDDHPFLSLFPLSDPDSKLHRNLSVLIIFLSSLVIPNNHPICT